MTCRKHTFARALLGALSLTASSALTMAEHGLADDLTLTPLNAASFNIGARHLVSYFTVSDSNCKLTVMIADAQAEDAIRETGPASRLQLAIDPGKSARVDTADGGAASFACADDTQSMKVSKIERLAVASPRE